MKRACLILLMFWAASGLLPAQTGINVNSKYLVESVDIAGGSKTQVSRGLRADMENLVGKNLDQSTIEKIAGRIRTELHARLVSPKVSKGTKAEQVIVLFEAKGLRPRQNFDLSLPKAIYNSRQGWSGILNAKFNAGDSQINLGITNDGDALLERFAGVTAGYENRHVFTDRVRLGFQFASFHQQWSGSTLTALQSRSSLAEAYRTRQDFAPSATFVLAEPLTLSVGASFQRFQKPYPAAHTEASNAVTTTLRFKRRLEGSEGPKQDLEAGYSLRAATRTFDSDYAYARHEVEASYAYRWNHQVVGASFLAGTVSGRPPLFERFVLGNASTLRGWSKFDLEPLGGTRVAHGSLEYSYHGFKVFYDTGALWTSEQSGETKHSLGVGYGDGDGFFLALAFPLKSGRVIPVFTTGVAF